MPKINRERCVWVSLQSIHRLEKNSAGAYQKQFSSTAEAILSSKRNFPFLHNELTLSLNGGLHYYWMNDSLSIATSVSFDQEKWKYSAEYFEIKHHKVEQDVLDVRAIAKLN